MQNFLLNQYYLISSGYEKNYQIKDAVYEKKFLVVGKFISQNELDL